LEEIKADAKIEGLVENLRGSKITKESEKIASQVSSNIKAEVDNIKKVRHIQKKKKRFFNLMISRPL